jgi:predicted nucleic acid-binding protein
MNFDTNVVLDVMLDREPFAGDAAFLLSKVEQNQISGHLCVSTVTTIHYLIIKALGPRKAVRHIQSVLSLLSIAPVNRGVLDDGFARQYIRCLNSFGDRLQHDILGPIPEACFSVTGNTSAQAC